MAPKRQTVEEYLSCETPCSAGASSSTPGGTRAPNLLIRSQKDAIPSGVVWSRMVLSGWRNPRSSFRSVRLVTSSYLQLGCSLGCNRTHSICVAGRGLHPFMNTVFIAWVSTDAATAAEFTSKVSKLMIRSKHTHTLEVTDGCPQVWIQCVPGRTHWSRA